MSRGKKEKKENFFRYGCDKRKTRENVDPLQKEIGDLLPWAMEIVEVLTICWPYFLVAT